MKKQQVETMKALFIMVLFIGFLIMAVVIIVKEGREMQDRMECLRPYAKQACEEANATLVGVGPWGTEMICQKENVNPRDPTEQTFELKFLDEEVERCLK